MKRNVGTIDALVRISLGLFGLAWGISKMVSTPKKKFPVFIAFYSAIKAAEGITRFCPGLALLGLNTLDGLNKDKKTPYAIHHFARKKIEEAPPFTPLEEKERGAILE